MKRTQHLWLIGLGMVGCLACVIGSLSKTPVQAQTVDSYGFTIYTYIDSDGTYIYASSYFESDYTELDVLSSQATWQVSGPSYSDPGTGESLTSGPVTPGDTYNVVFVYDIQYEYFNQDFYDPNCGIEEWCFGDAYPEGGGSIDVPYPPPQIASISPHFDVQGASGVIHVQGQYLQDTSGTLSAYFRKSDGTNDNDISVSVNPGATASDADLSYSISPTALIGDHQLVLQNSGGESEPATFTVNSATGSNACTVTYNPQAGYSSIESTGTANSGTMFVTFSGTDFSALTASVRYGPYSTRESIAAHIAALITKNYFRYGLSAKAFGRNVIYSGNTTLGTVSNRFIDDGGTSPSFTTINSPAAATEVENACNSAPPPPKSMYAVAYSAYIPVDHVLGPDQCTYTDPIFGSNPAQLIYRGDAWHNTYRVTQAVSLNFTSSRASGPFNDTGTTENYGFGSPYNGPAADLSSNDDDQLLHDCHWRNAIGKADTNGWLITPTVLNTGAIVGMTGEGQNPLSAPFGSISWSMTTDIDATSSTGHVAYQHTCYPAHQVKVANTTLYRYIPIRDDEDYIVKCLTQFNPEITGSSPTMPIH